MQKQIYVYRLSGLSKYLNSAVILYDILVLFILWMFHLDYIS